MAQIATTRTPKKSRAKRTYDALPDTVDFRDAMYVPALLNVPRAIDIDEFRAAKLPVLDQGKDGACTGFALATVANYLLRVRGKDPEADEVSAWMLYAMAKRYDEWPGENYSGSSARGAIKGWYKHGLCAWKYWESAIPDALLASKRAADAIERPLGAYFRVNHLDLVAMHAAISEVGILFATGMVHSGWQDLRKGSDTIPFNDDTIGGHAFAIVGYDREGFWIQNSWGEDWGIGGLARLTYDDWLINGSDVWVAALGAPITLNGRQGGAVMRGGAPRRYASHVVADLKPHIVTARNEGALDPSGDYGLTPEALETLISETMPARMAGWTNKPKRVLLYAHGGLVGQEAAVQTVANNVDRLLAEQVYPLSFIWRSDAWTTLKDILQDAMRRRRDEGILDNAKDFMLDRVDDTLEPAARLLGGKALWQQMKQNALAASTGKLGAAKLAADALTSLYEKGGFNELHLVGHSAGSILHGPLARHLADAKVPIKSLTLWAPACTVEFFKTTYQPLLDSGAIERFALFTLEDATERDDDCAHIYNKSLLYLVSGAFEARPRIPLRHPNGTAILGLARDIRGSGLTKLFDGKSRFWTVAPSADSNATHHGDFDDDPTTRLATLNFIRGGPPVVGQIAVGVAARMAVASPDQRRHARLRLDTALVG